MPLSKYNAAFGGARGSAEKAHAAMSKEYGPEKGERVFYATMNSRMNRAGRSTRSSSRRTGRSAR